MIEPRHSLTPAEMRDLNIIGARARMDRGDLAPMLRVTYTAAETIRRVIPWREALNLEAN